MEVDGPLLDGVALPTAVAFFACPDNRAGDSGETLRWRAKRADLPAAAYAIVDARSRLIRYVGTHADREALLAGFRAVDREHTRRADGREPAHLRVIPPSSWLAARPSRVATGLPASLESEYVQAALF